MHINEPSKSRWACLPAALVLALPLTACGGETEPHEIAEPLKIESQPNIVLIIADDLGWGDPSPYGNLDSATLAMSRLARDGTLFTQFYVASPVCSPSRAAFLTGRFPSELGFHHVVSRPEFNRRHGVPNHLDPSIPLLTQSLKKAGYYVGHFGKWHLGRRWMPEMAAYGIDRYRTFGSLTHPFEDERTPSFWTESSDKIVDETIAFVRENANRPFFVNVWFLIPHVPLNPTEEALNRFKTLGPRNSSYRGTKQIYYASVFSMDRAMLRLLRTLKEERLASNTIVIFTSDNGPEENEVPDASYVGAGSTGPFRGSKRSLYEGGIRMPLIVSWPGKVPAGRVDDLSIVSAVDLFPTLVKLVGGSVQDRWELDGEDVSDVLLGHARNRRTPLFWEWRFRPARDPLNVSPSLAVRDGDWKLLMNPGREDLELYDIRRDPSELQNLAEQYPRVADRLAERLENWSETLPPGPRDPHAGHASYPWPVGRGQVPP